MQNHYDSCLAKDYIASEEKKKLETQTLIEYSLLLMYHPQTKMAGYQS